MKHYYAVEISTPDDDVYSRNFPYSFEDANKLFESIELSDSKVPRVSLYHVVNHVCFELRRKETEAWKRSVELAKEELTNV